MGPPHPTTPPATTEAALSTQPTSTPIPRTPESTSSPITKKFFFLLFAFFAFLFLFLFLTFFSFAFFFFFLSLSCLRAALLERAQPRGMLTAGLFGGCTRPAINPNSEKKV